MGETLDRERCLQELRDWAARRAALDEDRPALMAGAWQAGVRSVAALARAAGISRDTVYADLRRQGIDYFNRDQDPRLTRLVRAVAALAMQFQPGHPFSRETLAAFTPALGEAAALLVSFQSPELVEAVEKVLAVSYASRDEQYLGSYLAELRAALDDYLRSPAIPPFKRVMRGRPAGRL